MSNFGSLLEPVAPTAEESQLALASSRRLTALLAQAECQTELNGTGGPTLALQLRAARHGTGHGVGQQANATSEVVNLPAAALPLLVRLLTELAAGHAVALLPVQAELSTQQAAELLNVSRPFLVGLLESRQLPCRMVGKHRRVLLQDVLAFKQRDDERRHAVLDELAAQAQELGMGY